MPDPTPERPADAVALARTFACHAARLMSDDKCEDVHVIDVRGLSQVTDFFVIASGTSERQMRSVADDLRRLARAEGHAPYGGQGDEAGKWLVMDFVDVVIHMFDADQRAYYDLDSLWGDGERVDWRQTTRPGQFARVGRDGGG